MFQVGDIVDYCGDYIPRGGPEYHGWLGMEIVERFYPIGREPGWGVKFPNKEYRYGDWFDERNIRLETPRTEWEELLLV